MSREHYSLSDLAFEALSLAVLGGYEDATENAKKLLESGVIAEPMAQTLRDALYGMFLSGVVETVRYDASGNSQPVEDIYRKSEELGIKRGEVEIVDSKIVSIEDFKKKD